MRQTLSPKLIGGLLLKLLFYCLMLASRRHDAKFNFDAMTVYVRDTVIYDREGMSAKGVKSIADGVNQIVSRITGQK